MNRLAKLRVTPLECRTNPSKFTVSLLSALNGDEGDTGASHSGSLSQVGTPTVDGADTAAAVKAALSGDIYVTLGGQTTTYTFDSTAGDVGSAFSIEVDGEQVRVGFEDMAGQPGCDWDYNDREWVMMVRQTGSETVVYTGSFPWAAWTNETATVTVTVTQDKPGYEGLYHWKYLFENHSFNTSSPGFDQGLGMFILRAPEPSQITNLENSMGWDGYVGLLTGDPELVHWQAPEMGSRILPGQSGWFSFTSPVCEIADSIGEMYDASYAYGGSGQIKGPELMIRSVTWGSVNTAGALSTNRIPDGPMMPGGGKRIFADRLRPTDAPEDSGDQVYVRVELSHVVDEAKQIEGYLFDVDDPSSSDVKLDDEKAKPGASPGSDNRGTTLHLGTQLVTVPAGQKIGKIKLKLSTQPGDNFRFAANLDVNEILGGTVMVKEQGPVGNVTYGDGTNAGIYFTQGRGAAVPNQDAKTVKSELLTVWRRLHVELDSMAKPLAGEMFDPDDEAPTDDLPKPDITLLRSNIMPAYVQVFDDINAANTRKTMPFVHNLERNVFYNTLMSTRDVESEEDFWVWHGVGGYEAGLLMDFDWVGANLPANETATKGETVSNKRGTPYVKGGSVIYFETIRDFQTTGGPFMTFPVTATPTVAKRRTVLHEALHRFGLDHDQTDPNNPGDQGPLNSIINCDATKDADHALNPAQLDYVRSCKRP